jgi:DMSO/TMAO reductase YedYZ molybdopterin-dependent catalytic subunit
MALLRVEGAVAAARDFAFADLARLPEQIADVGALAPGRTGGAVRLRAILDAVAPAPTASRLRLESSDGQFSQEAPLAGLQSAVVIYRQGEAPLSAEQGGPVRFLVPNVEDCDVPGVDRCTNVKALARIVVA